MNSLIEECSYKENLKVFCGTFNVNAKYPSEDLRAWLFVDPKPVDVYAIGLQEVVDLNTSSFLLQSDWLERENAWVEAINSALIDKEADKNYILVEKIRMFGLLLLVYVNGQDLVKSIYEIFKSEVPTGIMETVGNKGSVGISMKIHETRICFVCSHFAADTDKVAKRNSDYRSTKQKLKFVYNANLDYYDLESHHDIIFWFGDLNYRIDTINLVKAISLIDSNELDELIIYDQLKRERKLMNIFEDYNEGEIQFRPTYKYLVGHDKYAKLDLLKTSPVVNELACDRIAYTDRVLWRAVSNLNVKLEKYACINTITISDHKPVFAFFEIEVKRIDVEKYNKKYDEWLKDTDRRTNDEMPHITASHHEAKFTNLYYYDERSFDFTVKNKGIRLTNVGIKFYDPSTLDHSTDNETRVSNLKHKQWIEINPHHKERLPPEGEFKIELKTKISNENISRLNQTPDLTDFLIISCLNGNDVFFTVSIDYQRTIIGYSLKALGSLKREEKFADANLNLLSQVEGEIEEFENNCNSLWLSSLKKVIQENEMLRFNSTVKHENNPFVVNNKLDLYKKCLCSIKSELVYKDKYYNIDLAAQYDFYLNYLIKRSRQESDATGDMSRQANSMTVEDQKNLILKCLSTNEFENFELQRFDIEILVEVLKDLLNSLPSSLIPIRYIDYLMYADNDYKEYLLILNYIPKSHLKLFELVVKFLQIYKNSECNYIIANAIFKLKLDMTKLFNTSFVENNPTDKDHYKRQTADKFLNLFIQNYLS